LYEGRHFGQMYCLLEIMSQYQNDETQAISLHLHETEHKKTQMQRNVLKHVIKVKETFIFRSCNKIMKTFISRPWIKRHCEIIHRAKKRFMF